MDPSVAIQLISIILMLLLSAFFSSAETALTTANKIRIQSLAEGGNKRAARVMKITADMPKMLSAILVGNNIVLVVYGLKMADLLTPLFSFTDNQFVITLLQTIIATIIVLFTGEFLPKTLFRINPNSWLRAFSWLVFLFSWLTQRLP